MHLRDIQKTNPWGTTGTRAYKPEAEGTDRQIAHAIAHAVKAAGKLTEQVEAHDHVDKPPVTAESAKKYAADLVIVAMRLANLLGFDLEDELIYQIKTKKPNWPSK